MVTAELSIAPRTLRNSLPATVWRQWLAAYITVWGLTAAGALCVFVSGGLLRAPLRMILQLPVRPSPTHAPRLTNVVVLAAHNIPVCCWPLLLGVIGAHRSRISRRVGDIAIFAWLSANALPVGVALGLDGARLLAYVPQLPVEWAALALGMAGWLVQRRQPLAVMQRLVVLAMAVLLLLGAAVLETYAVPYS